MKILLITNYWYPYNNPGAFRWIGYSKYLDFDVLTSVKPSIGFLDYSIDNPNKKVLRFGRNIPAVIWGLIAPFIALFLKYDVYIITSPPESLMLGAYIMQSMGKKVLVDLRDPIKRTKQRLKILIPIYTYFYKKLKNVIVCMKFIDPSKPCVYHGYDDIIKNNNALKEPIFYTGKVNRKSYLLLLSYGVLQDYSHREQPCVGSSYQTIKKLGFTVNAIVHPELQSMIPISNKEAVSRILEIINAMK